MLNLFINLKANPHISCNAGTAPEWTVVDHGFCQEYQGTFEIYGHEGRSLAHIPGRVIEWRNIPVEVYLFHPPRNLRMHPHGRCLQLVTPDGHWFRLHWEKPARTFDQARAYVEHLMAETLIWKE